jgi:hypothetical protein
MPVARLKNHVDPKQTLILLPLVLPILPKSLIHVNNREKFTISNIDIFWIVS